MDEDIKKLLTGAVGQIPSIASDLLKTGYNIYQQNQLMDYNAEQARINREWQEQMMDKMNAYNTPAQQMARLKAAGLNPALLQGQPMAEAATSSGGSEASLGSAPFQQIRGYDPLSVAQIKNIESQTELNNSKLPLLDRQVALANTNIELNLAKVKEIGQNINESESRIALNKQLGEESAQKVINMVTENQQAIESFPAKLQLLQYSADEKGYLSDVARQQAATYMEELRSRLAVNAATIRELNSRSDLNADQRAILSAQLDQIEEQTRAIEIDNDIKKGTGKAAAIVGMINSTLSTLADCANVANKFLPKSKITSTQSSTGVSTHSQSVNQIGQ